MHLNPTKIIIEKFVQVSVVEILKLIVCVLVLVFLEVAFFEDY